MTVGAYRDIIKRDTVGHCCGAHVFYDFGGTDTTSGDNIDPISLKTLKKYLKEAKFSIKAMQMIILNEEQVDHLEDAILESGFELIKKCYNPNHQHVLSLYMRYRDEDGNFNFK